MVIVWGRLPRLIFTRSLMVSGDQPLVMNWKKVGDTHPSTLVTPTEKSFKNKVLPRDTEMCVLQYVGFGIDSESYESGRGRICLQTNPLPFRPSPLPYWRSSLLRRLLPFGETLVFTTQVPDLLHL